MLPSPNIRVMNSAHQKVVDHPNDIYSDMPSQNNLVSSDTGREQRRRAIMDNDKNRESQDEYVSYDHVSEEQIEDQEETKDWQIGEIEAAEQDSFQGSVEEETDQGDKHLQRAEVMPFVKQQRDLRIDLKLGWKPQEDVCGAPIPLLYNFDLPQIKEVDQETGLPIEPLYFGPRYPTSFKMHKIFANRDKASSCEMQIPSYKFDFPLVEKKPQANPQLSMKANKDEKPRLFTGMNAGLVHEKELRFDSMFESGNLDMVISPKPWEYDMYMRVDTNTRGHHQWFYFSVSYDCPKHFSERKIKFNVCNFTKPFSLYQHGMRICVARQSQGYHWHKAGEDIKYGKSKAVRRWHNDPWRVRYFNALSFNYTLGKNDRDTIYFAYCFPYTFSKLTAFLKQLQLDCNENERDCLKEALLCKSLSGLSVPLLTITSRIHTDSQYNLIRLEEFEDPNSRISLPMWKKKKYAVISGRIHPGETPASWMMQGFLKCLTGDSHQAKQLRKRIVFKIVPMLNPDGVIAGNYRTSMAGNDLNRKFDEPDFRLHPTIWNIKHMTEQITSAYLKQGMTTDNLLFYIDMHGHSRRKNVFIFGPPVPMHSDKYLKARVIPKLLSEETEMFRYHSCSFIAEKAKEAAARICLYKEFNLHNCFTLEASFHGYFTKDKVTHEFTEALYEKMGAAVVNSLYEFVMICEEDERRKQIAKVERQKLKRKKDEEFQAQIATKDSIKKAKTPIKIQQISKANISLKVEVKPVAIDVKDKKRVVPAKPVKSANTDKPSSLQVPGQVGGKEDFKGISSRVSIAVAEELIEEDEDDDQLYTMPTEMNFYEKEQNGPENEVEVQSECQNNPNEPASERCQVERMQEVEVPEPTGQKPFRNLDDIFSVLKKADSDYEENDSDQEDKLHQVLGNGATGLQAIESGRQENDKSDEEGEEDKEKEDDDPDQGGSGDDLTDEQMKQVGKKILNSIKVFRKQYNFSENQYFALQNSQQLVESTHTKPPTKPPQKAPVKKPQPVAQLPSTNYQSNTMSIAQKRRSFLEQKLPISNEAPASKRKTSDHGGRRRLEQLTSDHQQHQYMLESTKRNRALHPPTQGASNDPPQVRPYQLAYDFIRRNQNDNLKRESSMSSIIQDNIATVRNQKPYGSVLQQKIEQPKQMQFREKYQYPPVVIQGGDHLQSPNPGTTQTSILPEQPLPQPPQTQLKPSTIKKLRGSDLHIQGFNNSSAPGLDIENPGSVPLQTHSSSRPIKQSGLYSKIMSQKKQAKKAQLMMETTEPFSVAQLISTKRQGEQQQNAPFQSHHSQQSSSTEQNLKIIASKIAQQLSPGQLVNRDQQPQTRDILRTTPLSGKMQKQTLASMPASTKVPVQGGFLPSFDQKGVSYSNEPTTSRNNNNIHQKSSRSQYNQIGPNWQQQAKSPYKYNFKLGTAGGPKPGRSTEHPGNFLLPQDYPSQTVAANQSPSQLQQFLTAQFKSNQSLPSTNYQIDPQSQQMAQRHFEAQVHQEPDRRSKFGRLLPNSDHNVGDSQGFQIIQSYGTRGVASTDLEFIQSITEEPVIIMPLQTRQLTSGAKKGQTHPQSIRSRDGNH